MTGHESGSRITSLCGRVVARAPRLILAVTVLVVGIGAIFAAGAPSALSSAGYEVSGSDSTRAAEIIGDRFAGGTPNIVIVATAADSVEGAEATESGMAVVEASEAMEGVSDVQSYWTTGLPALRSDDGRQAVIAVRIVGDEAAHPERNGCGREGRKVAIAHRLINPATVPHRSARGHDLEDLGPRACTRRRLDPRVEALEHPRGDHGVLDLEPIEHRVAMEQVDLGDRRALVEPARRGLGS